MGPIKSGAAIFLSALVAFTSAPAFGAEDHAAGFLTYTEEVPCPPRAAPARAHVARRRVRKHRVRRLAVVRPRTAPRVFRVRKKVRHHAPHIVRAAAPVPPRRCTVLRRDPLTAASFGYDAVAPILDPVSYAVEPGGPAIAIPAQAGGDPAIGDPPGGGAGGGGSGGGTGGGVSAAPEPDAWLLMMFGVGLCGWVLRRRRRETGAEVGA